MELRTHEVNKIPIIVDFDLSLRLLRKCTLANGYGLYYDLFGVKYYVTPDAEKVSRTEWTGTLIDGDYYIYRKERSSDIHPIIVERHSDECNLLNN